MQTIILAGGAGKRVFPLGANHPKPMFKLLGKPLIHHVIDALKEGGLKDVNQAVERIAPQRLGILDGHNQPAH